MRILLVICLGLFCATGCGNTDKPDNSKIQSPSDQAIGEPKPIAPEKVAPLRPAAPPKRGKAKPPEVEAKL